MSELKRNETNSTEFPPGHPYTVGNTEVDITTLREHQDNTYDINPVELEALAENISEVGLISPIIVRRVTDGGLQILSGHRRVRALKKLAKTDDKFRVVPARVYEGLSDEDALLILHSSNIARKMSQGDRQKQAELLETRVADLRGSHPEWHGKTTSDIIGNMLGMSGRTWRRKMRLAKHLTPRMHDYVDRGLLHRDVAESVSKLPEDEQNAVADALDRAEPKDMAQASGVISEVTKGVGEYQKDFDNAVRAMNVAYFHLRDAMRRSKIPVYIDKNDLRQARVWIDEVLES